MICKKCSKELREGAAFCSFCGTEVEKTLFCSYCNKEIDNEASFCPHCGISIKKEEKLQSVVIENTEPELPDESESEEKNVYIQDSEYSIYRLNIGTLGFAVLSFIMSCVNAYMIWYYWGY